MSFSFDVKSELCRLPVSRRCCAVAECYGILLTCNLFSPSRLRIVTEHPEFAQRLEKLFHRAFELSFDTGSAACAENGKYVFGITGESKIRKIYESFELSPADHVALHLNLGVIENDCCAVSLLRGAFLGGGSVTDPEKRYHLELTTTHTSVARELYSVLLDMDFSPKEIVRGGENVLYFKHSNQIEDFLTALGAPICAMKLMETKVEKNLRNDVNRRCNCDSGNLSKMIDASRRQLAAIERIRESGGWETLSPKLREIAELRIADPEAPLSELAQMLNLTKSAAAHRLRMLTELAGEGK